MWYSANISRHMEGSLKAMIGVSASAVHLRTAPSDSTASSPVALGLKDTRQYLGLRGRYLARNYKVLSRPQNQSGKSLSQPSSLHFSSFEEIYLFVSRALQTLPCYASACLSLSTQV